MDSGNGIHVLRPRVAVTKVAVSDKRNRYIFIICLSIEHCLGNKGMHCVTQGADAKAGDIDKGSGHIIHFYMILIKSLNVALNNIIKIIKLLEVTIMLIKVFDHKLLGCMDVFGDEDGMWFRFSDVVRCLEIDEDKTGLFKYRHLDPSLKKIQDINEDGRLFPHKFIHEKAVYEFMLIGNSKYCNIFQKWVGEIAFEMGILNRNVGECKMDQQEITDYQYVATYINNLDAKTPAEETLKEAFDRFDNKFQNLTVEYDNMKVIETEKDFDSSIEITTEEAGRSPYWHPKYNPDLNKNINDYSDFVTKEELIEHIENDNIECLDFITKDTKKHFYYDEIYSNLRQKYKDSITYNEFEPENDDDDDDEE